MANDMFLHIPEIEGESHRIDHTGHIDVMRWSWGVAQHGSLQRGGNESTSRASVGDVTVTKFLDKATPNLYYNCVLGKCFPYFEIINQKAGGDALPYYILKFEKCIITGVSAEHSDEDPIEAISFSFEKFTITYKTQSPDGSLGAAIETNWDIRANQGD